MSHEVNISGQENSPYPAIGLLTIVISFYEKGRLFKAQEQFCFFEQSIKLVGCGCGGKKREEVPAYKIYLNNVIYELEARYVVDANWTVIPCEDRDFEKRRENIGDTQQVHNFDPYRQNNNVNDIIASANNIPM